MIPGVITERVRSLPYYPALTHPVFRRVLPGAAASALGDGMSAVAIAWLALKLAPAGSRGLWVGAVVAAYSLPGAVGAVALRRWLRGHRGARLVFVNAVLRASALGLIGCLAPAGRLDPAGYVLLLGMSSLLSAWGMAGKYTLIADLLPAEQRVAGNTVFGLADQLSLMIGPALAGVVAALLGVFWAVFGAGAITGELAAPFLRRWPVWPTMTGIVLGWGLALIPLGLPAPLWAGLAAFFAGAVIWGPWTSLSMAVFQDATPPAALAQVIAARGSLLILAAPLGTALGGPIVAALGARGTLLASALATIALGLLTVAVLARARKRTPVTGR
jgi:MFS family permease